ncbi:helix-turn-helix domain-containing protein [Halovivax limisalsi]|uniref:helix-turn-helix domain-containing protein n=1 Tax=Halovivax limisalsi TaxID=1453760 RepID=UPI001FFDCFC5|nr:helix-turn-helix domain-containing protein [Halovivax limisalsi]
MKSLRIAIRPNAELMAPEGNLAVAATGVDRHLILGGSVLDGTETTISYVEGAAEDVEPILESAPTVDEYDITPTDGGCFVYCRQELSESALTLFDAFFQDTIVVVPPYECRSDGSIRMTVVGSPSEVQAVLEEFPDAVDVDVLRVGDTVGGPASELSERQREAVAVAWDCGYYDVPRDRGIEAVAADLDCAVSTASDLLRRAESRLVANALDVRR